MAITVHQGGTYVQTKTCSVRSHCVLVWFMLAGHVFFIVCFHNICFLQPKLFTRKVL
ncbi:hypothetical protein BDR07DRAFT_1438160, partial [Suillus spraguei]